ncbi:MAG: EfeM/EfeO family lipoprotein, partial [Burkholderiales bacterium]|nr:EfeM/EfeO family lipoprotein [Anaerolineae bacterium]
MKRVILIALLLVVSISTVQAQDSADLSGIKDYLQANLVELQASAVRLETAAAEYYTLAEAVDFDYEALWSSSRLETITALLNARDAWLAASPLYEQVEGVVAGVPSLSEYDVILDAGASGADDPEGGVNFDLNLRDGSVLERPGNLFGVLETTLWGTREDYSSGVAADLNLNSEADFGELLPDADVLVTAAESMRGFTDDLVADAEAWQPTNEDAFTALVVMVPTMSEYFAAWRDSRFVAGDESTQSDFVVISRLSDIEDILGGLIVVYDNVSPMVSEVDATQHQQIDQGLTDLQGYVSELYAEERAGRVFTAEEADIFGSEAQGRAQAITGQIAQVAALLDITLPEE